MHYYDEVEIAGTGFGNDQTKVVFWTGSGTRLAVVSWTDTVIRVVINSGFPANPYGLHGITVETDEANGGVKRSNSVEVNLEKSSCELNVWSCGDWGACSVAGQETRSCTKNSTCPSSPGESPILSRSCTPPSVTPNIFAITPSKINLGGQVEISGENFGDSAPSSCPALATPPGVSCGLLDGNNRPQRVMSWSNTKIVAVIDNTDVARYSGDLQPIRAVLHGFVSNNDKTREGKSGYVEVKAPLCDADTWSCGEWTSCSAYGTRTRSCTKTFDCPTAYNQSPTSQTCTPPPACFEDTWTCGDWNSCSQGVQSRSCKRLFDCSGVEDASPATSRSCTTYEVPAQDSEQSENTNREQILRATVKLECPTPDGKFYSQGSGTVIDEYGSILTNRHVIIGTIGACRVGFITNEDDAPSFSQVADVKSASTDQSANGDMALLKIRNSGGRKFTAVDIFKGSSSNLKSGDTILPFGYPDENLYGQTITFTEGPYSGKGTTIKVAIPCDKPVKYLPIDVSGFFKTTASIDHGNSGGGAYQKSTGYYMGMPTLGNSCNPNIPSRINHILSINTIKRWLSSFGSYNVAQNNYANLNNYLSSNIKIEEIDVRSLRPLDSPTPDAVVSNKVVEKSKGKNVSEIVAAPAINPKSKDSQPGQTIKSPGAVKSTASQSVSSSATNNQAGSVNVQPKKKSWVKRSFSWLSNLFSKMAK